MKEYRKRYWPLVVWALALTPAMIGAAKAAEGFGLDDRVVVAVMMAAVTLMLLVLFWMIWKGGYVYWINGGPSYEQARDAGGDVRREYAGRHFKAMLKGCICALALLAAECVLGVYALWMILSAGVCIIASAISTIRIRWTEEDQSGSKN